VFGGKKKLEKNKPPSKSVLGKILIFRQKSSKKADF